MSAEDKLSQLALRYLNRMLQETNIISQKKYLQMEEAIYKRYPDRKNK